MDDIPARLGLEGTLMGAVIDRSSLPCHGDTLEVFSPVHGEILGRVVQASGAEFGGAFVGKRRRGEAGKREPHHRGDAARRHHGNP